MQAIKNTNFYGDSSYSNISPAKCWVLKICIPKMQNFNQKAEFGFHMAAATNLKNEWRKEGEADRCSTNNYRFIAKNILQN